MVMVVNIGLDPVEGHQQARRMRRQDHILDQSKQFIILMAEAALRWHPGSVDLQVHNSSRSPP